MCTIYRINRLNEQFVNTQSTKCNQISLCPYDSFMRQYFFGFSQSFLSMYLVVLLIPVPVKYRTTQNFCLFLNVVYSFLTLSTKPNWLFYLLRACAHFQFRLNSSEVFSAFLMHETHSTHSLAQMFIDAKTTEKKLRAKQLQNFSIFTFSSIISVFDLFVVCLCTVIGFAAVLFQLNVAFNRLNFNGNNRFCIDCFENSVQMVHIHNSFALVGDFKYFFSKLTSNRDNILLLRSRFFFFPPSSVIPISVWNLFATLLMLRCEYFFLMLCYSSLLLCACVFAGFVCFLFSLNACAIDAARLYTELFVGPGAQYIVNASKFQQ